MSYSLLALRQALAEEAFSGQFPIRILTTGAGTASSIVIGDLAHGATGITVNAYHDCWLYNTHTTITAPFSSKVLSQGGLTVATGALGVAPAFGSSPGTGMEIIFCYDVHPDELHRAINRILRNLAYFAYLPVTLVTDGDMEDTGVTNWAADGTPDTREKSATNPFFFGRQTLHIVDAASGHGAVSNPVAVIQGEPLTLSVPVQVVTGSAQVILQDATAGSAIDSVTVDESLPVTVQFNANAPSGCETVTVRLLTASATSEFYVGPVSLLSQHRKRYGLDSIERTADVKDLFKIPQGQNAVASDSFYSFSEFNPDVSFLLEEDARAGSPMNIVLPTYPTQPYFMRVQRTFPELTVTAATINAATNTTNADRDTVIQGAMHYIERARYARLAASNPTVAAIHLGRSREYARKFAMMRQRQGYGLIAREIPAARSAVAMS